MQNRKGLSDVVSTVLIILLVVAAIAIIGAIVLNVVQNAGNKIDNTVACQSVDIKAASCLVNATYANGTISRGSNGNDVVLSDVSAYFMDANGVTVVTKTGLAVSPNNATLVPVTAGANVKKMAVSYTISGSSSACPLTTAITCG